MSKFYPFPGYNKNADRVYRDDPVWEENRGWLEERGAKLLSVDEANRLPISKLVRMYRRDAGKNYYLYRAFAPVSFQTILLPYEPDDQENIFPKNMDRTYAEIVSRFVCDTFNHTKYLCALDPDKCCVAQIGRFDYDLLYSFQTLNMVTPFLLTDEKFSELVIFNFDLPLQQIAAKSLREISGQSRKKWNEDYSAYVHALKENRRHDDHLVGVLEFYMQNALSVSS